MAKIQAGYSFGHYGGANVREMFLPPKGYLIKDCSICGGKALYYSGRQGFCADHKADAIKATQKRTNNESYIMRTMRDPAQPYESEVAE